MKGFTLIELLAVIVILAIILLIAVPMITGVVESSKIASFEISAKMIASAAKLEYFSDGNKEKTFLIEDGLFVGEKLELNGEVPENGQIIINSNGDVSLALHDGKYCAKKDYEGNVVVTETLLADCTIAVLPTGPNYIQLLLSELNSTITNETQVNNLDRTQLQSIINSTISGESDLSFTTVGSNDLVELVGTNKDYYTELHQAPYSFSFIPNINTTKIVSVSLEPTGDRYQSWKPTSLSEYNQYSSELPAHKIVVLWSGSTIHSSWNTTVNTEASTNSSYRGTFMLLAFNTVSNQFEAYLCLFEPV